MIRRFKNIGGVIKFVITYAPIIMTVVKALEMIQDEYQKLSKDADKN